MTGLARGNVSVIGQGLQSGRYLLVVHGSTDAKDVTENDAATAA